MFSCSIQHVIRTLVGATATFFTYHFFHLPQGMWMILACLLLLQIILNEVWYKYIFVIVLTGLLMTGNAWLIQYVRENTPLLVCYLFVVTLLTGYVGLKYSNYFFPAISINLFGMAALGMQMSEADRIGMVENSVMGICIALIIRMLFWPPTFKRNFKQLIIASLQALNSLQKKIFSIYLNRNYQQAYYVVERNLHQSRLHFFRNIQYMREALTNKKGDNTKYQNNINHINSLFALILSLGSLRYQIEDHTAFEICEKEFKEISNDLTELINAVIEGRTLNQASLMLSIDALEKIYLNTLGVITKDPVKYLLFLEHLKITNKTFSVLASDLRQL